MYVYHIFHSAQYICTINLNLVWPIFFTMVLDQYNDLTTYVHLKYKKVDTVAYAPEHDEFSHSETGRMIIKPRHQQELHADPEKTTLQNQLNIFTWISLCNDIHQKPIQNGNTSTTSFTRKGSHNPTLRFNERSTDEVTTYRLRPVVGLIIAGGVIKELQRYHLNSQK
jgi:hypothetical protein